MISINDIDYFKVEISWFLMKCNIHQITNVICKIYLRIYFSFFQDVTFVCYSSSNLTASFDSFSSTKFPLEMVETKMKKGRKDEKKGRVSQAIDSDAVKRLPGMTNGRACHSRTKVSYSRGIRRPLFISTAYYCCCLLSELRYI